MGVCQFQISITLPVFPTLNQELFGTLSIKRLHKTCDQRELPISFTWTVRLKLFVNQYSFVMLYLILICFIVLLVVGPSFWVRHTMEKYSEPADRYSFTGAQLARDLLNQANLQHVGVEETKLGDHYDPLEKKVRLAPDKFNGRSLTAIAVAAHEVGHAIQDRDNYPSLALRTTLVQWAAPVEKLGAGILMLAPVIMMVLRAPGVGLLLLAGGIMTLGSAALVHALTLPMELNASFARALPILERGRYLIDGDMPHARRLLNAAAWTYVAASLMTLLNIARWLAILRR